MFVEYIRCTCPSAGPSEFQGAYRRAGRVLDADPHCVRWEVARGRRSRSISWCASSGLDRGHEQGFRSSAQSGEFFAAVKPLFDQIQEMKHYQVQSSDRAQCPAPATGLGPS